MEKEHPTLEVKIEELEEAVEVGQAVELTEFAAFRARQAALEQARQEKASQELNAALQSDGLQTSPSHVRDGTIYPGAVRSLRCQTLPRYKVAGGRFHRGKKPQKVKSTSRIHGLT